MLVKLKIGFVLITAYLAFVFAHPYYVSITDLKYNDKSKTLEISCKMFVNDIEDALKKTSKKQIDILNPKNRKEVEAILFDYLKKRFIIRINNKPVAYSFLGYEKDEEYIAAYLEVKNSEKPKLMSLENKILYDFLKEQVNLINAQVGVIKKSYKLNNPDGAVTLEFK